MNRILLPFFISFSLLAEDALNDQERITIEGIANDAVNGGIMPILLDALLYAVIFSAVLTICFFIFMKFKIFSRSKQPKQNAQTKISVISVKEAAEEIAQSQDKITKPQPKQEKTAAKKHNKTAKAKREDKPKSLFDI